jgi:hypothetical protein
MWCGAAFSGLVDGAYNMQAGRLCTGGASGGDLKMSNVFTCKARRLSSAQLVWKRLDILRDLLNNWNVIAA